MGSHCTVSRCERRFVRLGYGSPGKVRCSLAVRGEVGLCPGNVR